MGSYYNYMLTESRKANMEQVKANAQRWIWVTFKKEGNFYVHVHGWFHENATQNQKIKMPPKNVILLLKCN